MLIFGGSAYSYARDFEFKHVSSNPKYWQKVIDGFYEKYAGLAKWHTGLLQTVIRDKQLVMPSGRIFTFQQYRKESTGEMEWPRTQILNFPVQSTGADWMCIYRLRLYRILTERYTTDQLRFISTVHDSVEIDCLEELVEDVHNTAHAVAAEMPQLIEKVFGVKYNLPFVVEVENLEDKYPV